MASAITFRDPSHGHWPTPSAPGTATKGPLQTLAHDWSVYPRAQPEARPPWHPGPPPSGVAPQLLPCTRTGLC